MTGRGRPKAKAPERANGEGNIQFCAGRSKPWRVRLRVGSTPEGKGIVKGGYYADRDEANAELVLLRRQYTGITVVSGQILTVAELAEEWLETINAQRVVSTRTMVEADVRRHVTKGSLANLPVDKIGRRHVQAWLNDMRDRGFVKDTILTYRKHLNQICEWAIANEDTGMRVNPVSRAAMPANIKPTKKRTTFTLEEAERFVATCQLDDEPWGPFFLTTLLLGLRPGEASGLQWGKVVGDTVHIDTALKRAEGGKPHELGPTKTEHTRTVRALPEVLDALTIQRGRQEVARLVAGDSWPTEWDGVAFLSTNDARPGFGAPVYSSAMRKALDALCVAAAVPRKTPYELRHSCASILLARQVNITEVANMLGTSERMLRRHYHHLIDPVISVGADAWGEILGASAG